MIDINMAENNKDVFINYYIIKDGVVETGCSIKPPEGATVYEIGNEPDELLESVKPTPEQLAEQAKAEARQYLADTDWYIERLNDPSSGKAVPDGVLVKRAEARAML